jgi:hypothetical protein
LLVYFCFETNPEKLKQLLLVFPCLLRPVLVLVQAFLHLGLLLAVVLLVLEVAASNLDLGLLLASRLVLGLLLDLLEVLLRPLDPQLVALLH